uniref:Uncharacterized protein n=1 Tax=Anguilla anguilla TaxID=7936 RepID=A0A0E9X6C5_ANGAN
MHTKIKKNLTAQIMCARWSSHLVNATQNTTRALISSFPTAMSNGQKKLKDTIILQKKKRLLLDSKNSQSALHIPPLYKCSVRDPLLLFSNYSNIYWAQKHSKMHIYSLLISE